jgi:choline dehydrogenase-like flavoprotein
LNIPNWADFNDELRPGQGLSGGTGYLPISYNPETGERYSTSTDYIWPILQGQWKRSNLTVLTNAWVNRVNLEGEQVRGVHVTLSSGRSLEITATAETILCAGSIDTPRLLLLSGIGPRAQLESLGIRVRADIPGVGENLQDHPESYIVWEMNRPIPPETATWCDAFLLYRSEAELAARGDQAAADMYIHMFTASDDNYLSSKLGYQMSTIPHPTLGYLVQEV